MGFVSTILLTLGAYAFTLPAFAVGPSCDATEDGALNVLDVVKIVNAVLNPETAQAICAGPTCDTTIGNQDSYDEGYAAGYFAACDDAEATIDFAGMCGGDAVIEGCFAEQSCESPMFVCWAPDESLPCGMCMMAMFADLCTDDSSCGVGAVCEWDQSGCLCSPAQVCVAACTAGSCDEGETCGADGHCATMTCDMPGDCPPNFHCDAGGCLRAWCSASEQCDGYCVKNRCHTEPGYCSPLPL